MDNLTSTQLKVLNNLSKVHDDSVLLGEILKSIISSSGENGTPVNAVAATATLGISGVSIHGETFTIGNDTYEFLADAAQSKSDQDNIAINITTKTAKATVNLTVATQPTSGDTFTIGTTTYIFVPAGTANYNGEIAIGSDLAATQAAIVAAINGTDDVNSKHSLVGASAFTSNVSAITALIGGTVGNTIPSTETFTATGNVFSAATLGSGTNCTAANTALVIIAAINANANSVVTAASGLNNDVTVTADVCGVSGNAIAVSDTMANGSFGADVNALSGGIDGTVAEGTKFMFDSSYMYICPAGNTVAQKNWRRVSIGSAY